MFSRKAEITVGIFMVAGVAALVYLSVSLGNIDIFGSRHYSANAIFSSITGLREGASVEIAGVNIGKVDDIKLQDGMALVEMKIDKDVELTDDSIASIRTKGVIGAKYVRITPGGSDIYLEDGDSLIDTESAISLEDLISKYIFEQ